MAWSDMEPKQKGMLVAVIIIFVIIGYMVYKLFFAGSSYTPPPPAAATAAPQSAAPATPSPAAAAANSAGADLAVTDNNTQAGAMPNAAPSATAADAPQVVEIPKRELTPEELALLEERRQVQQQYLQLVNQYQLMEMQNKVATSQSTLVKTQISTAKSEQEAAKLGLVLPGQAQDDNTDKSLRGVTLVYVGQKNGVWTAVLNLRGNYVTVKLGARLPDNSLVSKINENSIVLYKDGERRTLMVPMVVDHDTSGVEDTNTDDAGNNNTNNDNASSGNASSANTGN